MGDGWLRRPQGVGGCTHAADLLRANHDEHEEHNSTVSAIVADECVTALTVYVSSGGTTWLEQYAADDYPLSTIH
jgi:hypothetical protein